MNTNIMQDITERLKEADEILDKYRASAMKKYASGKPRGRPPRNKPPPEPVEEEQEKEEQEEEEIESENADESEFSDEESSEEIEEPPPPPKKQKTENKKPVQRKGTKSNIVTYLKKEVERLFVEYSQNKNLETFKLLEQATLQLVNLDVIGEDTRNSILTEAKKL